MRTSTIEYRNIYIERYSLHDVILLANNMLAYMLMIVEKKNIFLNVIN
jgi:hypothetical protein